MNTETNPPTTIVTTDTTDTTTIVTIPPQEVAADLLAAGLEIATGHHTVGSAERRYAALMSSAFPGWHLIEANDDSNEAKLIKAGPKAKLFEQLKAAKHTNPSTVWARLRKYAAAVEATSGEGEGEGEQVDAGKRTIEVRLVEELLKLRKAIGKVEHPHEKIRAVDTFLELALNKLGVTVEAETTEQAAA
jgi:hypothetical protein